jgi:hypothetical protein
MTKAEPLSLRNDGASSTGAASENVIWLFAFAECCDALQQHLPDAAIEQRLMLHRVGSIVALIGVVPAADYCGADSEGHFADVAWLAPRVRRHALLVEWAAQWSSIFPAPFGTIYSTLDRLTLFMRMHEATIAAFLSAVANKEEWELRAVTKFDGPDALDQLACSAWPEWRNLSKGARYMRLCRDKSALLDFGRAGAAAFVHEFVATLRPFTNDVRSLDLPRTVDQNGPEPVARYALLVAKTERARIGERVREIASRAASEHVAITLTGPWPPFNFRPNLK